MHTLRLKFKKRDWFLSEFNQDQRGELNVFKTETSNNWITSPGLYRSNCMAPFTQLYIKIHYLFHSCLWLTSNACNIWSHLHNEYSNSGICFNFRLKSCTLRNQRACFKRCWLWIIYTNRITFFQSRNFWFHYTSINLLDRLLQTNVSLRASSERKKKPETLLENKGQ